MSATTERPQVSRGVLVTLGVVLGLAVLVLGYLYVVQPLIGETGEVAAPSVTSATPTPVPTPGATPAPTTEDGAEAEAEPEPVPETFEVFTARDPFQQLVVVQASGGGAGQASPAPSPTDGASPGPPPSATVGATTVRLVDVFTDAAGTEKILVTVNGTGYEVAEGETFAQRFRVLDIAGDCATLLFGDSRFTLCKGEEIRK